jgi:hypothetical protein
MLKVEELGPSRSRSFVQELTQPHVNTVLWTPHSSQGCSDSCSRTGRVSLYDRIPSCRFGYRALGGMGRDDVSRVQVGGETERGTPDAMRVIGSKEQICSPWTCQRNTRSTRLLRQIS